MRTVNLPGLMRKFWMELFAPGGLSRLASCRAVFFGSVLILYWQRDFSVYATVPRELWEPFSFYRILGLPIFSESTLSALSAVWKLSLFLACVGLFTRIAMWIAAVAGLYLLGLSYGFYFDSHVENMLPVAFFLFACSRADLRYSVDARIFRKRRHKGLSGAEGYSFIWPVHLIQTCFLLIFFAAGIAKLRVSGISWVLDNAVLNSVLFAQQWRFSNTLPGHDLIRDLFLQVPALGYVLGAYTVLLEVGVIAAVFRPGLRPLFVLQLACLQIGIAYLMNLQAFLLFLPFYLLFIPWERVVQWLQSQGTNLLTTQAGPAGGSQ